MAHVCAHGSLWIIKTPVPIILTHYLDPHFLLWTIWKCWLERSKGAMGIHTPQWWVKPKSYEYTVWWHSILSPFCWVRPIIAQFLLLQSQPQAMGSRFDVLLAPDDELDVKQASTWSLDFFWEISLDKYGKSMENCCVFHLSSERLCGSICWNVVSNQRNDGGHPQALGTLEIPSCFLYPYCGAKQLI